MVPLDAPEPPPVHAGPDEQVLSAALDALRSPLAVISGRAQLLERQIMHGHSPSLDDHLTVLAIIQRQVIAIEIQLRMLQAEAYRKRSS
jgi:signal transduction histidine kinase